MFIFKKVTPLLFVLVILLSGCSGINALVNPTATSSPTPTEQPMAAHVNGEGILLVDYQREQGLLQAAQKEEGIQADAQAQKTQVLDAFIDELLFSQSAASKGHVIDDAELQKRISDLAVQLGGIDKLDQWKSKYGYDDQAFQRTLKRNMAAAWMRDQVAAEVGTTADQVHARQIRVNDPGEAQSINAQLQAGTDFTQLASEYDPLTKGDLGWFPRGYLFQPTVEDTAFALQPGKFSGMLQTNIGYHFVLVIERDAQHPLSPDALLFLQHKHVNEWLKQKRADAKIEIQVP
jgi:peptidyl-prolyl cis-trans isomerase C